MNIANNENKLLCNNCGSCCKKYAGIVFPEQLPDINAVVLASKLKEGYCFDRYYTILDDDTNFQEAQDEFVYFMRPQHKGKENRKSDDGLWGGECVFLTDTGCKLTFDERPRQCQILVPSQNRICSLGIPGYRKRDAALAWLPYQNVIRKIVRS